MNEGRFNISLRKFLKEVGVTSQREIERMVREPQPGKNVLKGPIKVRVVVTAPGTNLNHVVEGQIDLD